MYRRCFHFQDDTYPFAARTMRMMTTFAFIAYPAGAILRVSLGPHQFAGGVIGNMLTFLAIMVMFATLISTMNAVVSADSKGLDEYQMKLRYVALSRAYSVLFCMLIFASAYLYFAFEFGLWTPRTKDAWQAIAMGFILAAILLPVTVLVWTAAPEKDEEEEEA